SFVLTGLDIDAKAALVERTLRAALDTRQFEAFETHLAHTEKADARTDPEASALLKVAVHWPDAAGVGRTTRRAVVEMALASYPGFFCTTPPTDASPFGVYWSTLIPADAPALVVVLEDGRTIPITPTEPVTGYLPFEVESPRLPEVALGPTSELPLG